MGPALGEGRHSRYVPPMTNPVFNETPYITTELRPFYFRHEIPNEFVTNGGSVDFVAVQARLAITERLGFIATKDGYGDFQFDETLNDTQGISNIALGLKYAFYSDPENEGIATGGLRYEIPINNLDTSGVDLMGDGSDFVNPFVTGAKAFGDLGLQANFWRQSRARAQQGYLDHPLLGPCRLRSLAGPIPSHRGQRLFCH